MPVPALVMPAVIAIAILPSLGTFYPPITPFKHARSGPPMSGRAQSANSVNLPQPLSLLLPPERLHKPTNLNLKYPAGPARRRGCLLSRAWNRVLTDPCQETGYDHAQGVPLDRVHREVARRGCGRAGNMDVGG